MSTTNMPRRALFHGTAGFLATAALPAALPAVALAAENPDAELLSAYRRIEAAEAELNALVGDRGPGCDERMESALCVADAAYLEVLPAKTAAGRRAKANALRWAFERAVCNSPNRDGRTSIATINEDGEWHERLAWSLARDVLAEG